MTEHLSPEPSIQHANYAERLNPGVGATCAAAGAAPMMLIVLLPVSLTAAIVGAILAGAIALGLLFGASPRITVHDGMLRAGRAHIDTAYLAEPEILDGAEAFRAELGPRLNARAFVVLRAGVARGIKVAVTDPGDPTPYWLLASRRPAELAAAIRGA